MNPLVTIPPELRRVVYAIYALIGLGLGATQVGYAAAEAGQPTWLTVTLAVFAFVGTGIGATAATNVSSTALRPLYGDVHITADRRDDRGASDVWVVVVVVLLVLILLAVLGVLG